MFSIGEQKPGGNLPRPQWVDRAMEVLALGLRPIPINPTNKKPYLEWKPFQKRPPTEEEVQEWYERWPEAEVGVLTGVGDGHEGIMAVDVDRLSDPETGKRKILPNPWPGTPDKELPVFSVLETPSLGIQYLMRHIPGIRCSTGKLAPGVDVKAEGGYTVIFGAGRRFVSGSLAEALRTDAPDWLKDELFFLQKSTEPLREGLNVILEGKRNVTLMGLGGVMRRRGFSEEAIAAALLVENRLRCEPPLPEDEVRRIATSVARYPPAQPLEELLPTFAPTTLQQFREEGVPARSDVIPNVLPRGGLLQVLGPPKGFKTWFCLNLALAAVRGDRFLDTWTIPRTRVLYLSGEGGPALLMERLAIMTLRDDPELVNFFLWTPQPGDSQLLVTHPLIADTIINFARAHDIGLIILDPLIAFHRQDENSTQEMATLAGSLLDLARRGNAGVVVAHHTGKGIQYRPGSPAQGRGSTVLWGSVDSSFVLDPHKGGARVTVQLRWAPSPDPLVIHLDPQVGRLIVMGTPKKALAPETVADVLRDGPADVEKISQVLERLGLPSSRKTIEKALKKLGNHVTYTTEARGRRIYQLREVNNAEV